VADIPIGDQLVRAVAAIDVLQDTIGKHAKILSILADKMAEIDKRVASVEKASKS